MIHRLLPIAFVFLFSLLLHSCTNKEKQQASSDMTDTLEVQEIQLSLTSTVDKLSPVESLYFEQFKNVEDFFISDSVVRYNRLENGKMVNFYNEVLYVRDAADLIGGIYMFYSLNFSPIESVDSDPFVNYSFRAGNASAGNGSIIKLGDKVILTQRGCETSCSTIVKENGKTVYKKVE